MQSSAGLYGSGTIRLGLADSELNILLQRFLIWGGIGGALGLLHAQPGDTVNGAFIGGLVGLLAGAIVSTILYYLETELVGPYRIGATALVVAVLLIFASIQSDRHRAPTR